MSEYNESALKLINTLKLKSFLFPKHMPAQMNGAEYVNYFEKRNKREFHQMPSMVHYNPDILDQYNDSIVWTGFLPTGGNGMYAMHTFVQINKKYHIIFLFGNEDGEPSVIATIYTTDSQDYLNFLENNIKYVIQPNTQVGFNSRNSLPAGFAFAQKSIDMSSKK